MVEFLGAEGTGAYGPYVALPPGRYVARLRFRAGWAPGGAALLDVSADNGESRLASRPFEAARLAALGMAVELPFEATAALSGVEVRLFCRPGFTGALEAVEIIRTGHQGGVEQEDRHFPAASALPRSGSNPANR